MLTVIFETRNDEDRLARALVPLVSAASEGFVRDVVVVDHGSTDGTLAVADTAGCMVVAAQRVLPWGRDKWADGGVDSALRRAAMVARGEWVLMLRIDRRPLPQGWQACAQSHLEHVWANGRADRAWLWGGRFRSGIRARFVGIVAKPDGVLMTKAEALRS